ncbi:hypothetical protein L484_014322 [Morus notabilis]|uniref:Thioredoxin-like fold domain-containing protein n=1 Tax=Morus notabilis TaxID=981085 RepID=W9RMD9_9ROSA|nr:hypothetical protein L484_014322 [Morus notabilis]
MKAPKHMTPMLRSAFFFFFFFFVSVVSGQSLPPAKLDGFVFGSHQVDFDAILIEAFFDPVCPDSRDSWPALKQVLSFYGDRVYLVLHLLPLPSKSGGSGGGGQSDKSGGGGGAVGEEWGEGGCRRHRFGVIYSDAVSGTADVGCVGEVVKHERLVDDRFFLICKVQEEGSLFLSSENCSYHDNAFAASRALHIVNNLNTSATFQLLEAFFKQQKKFYNAQTRDLPRTAVVNDIVKFASEAVGESYYGALKSGFDNRKTDLKTRISFKYSASRGVYGTPTFFVNGFQLPDSGSTLDFNGWKSFIDPLIGAKGDKYEENLHFFL